MNIEINIETLLFGNDTYTDHPKPSYTGSINCSPFIFNLNCEIVCKFLIVGLRLFQIRTVDGIKDFFTYS
jgi:hypothetical protein